MNKGVLLAVVLLLTHAGIARAQESEQEVENLVFVGRLVSIEELPDPCADRRDCISMDALWRAKYEIVQPLVGTYPQREITFSIADHYGFPRMAKFRNALLFVGLYSDGPWMHKYQGIAMHPLIGGGWGFCGSLRPREGEPPPPKSRRLPFAPDFGYVGEPGEQEELAQLFDQDIAVIDDGQIRCKRGLLLSELYEAARTGALRARGVQLPAWSDTMAGK